MPTRDFRIPQDGLFYNQYANPDYDSLLAKRNQEIDMNEARNIVLRSATPRAVSSSDGGTKEAVTDTLQLNPSLQQPFAYQPLMSNQPSSVVGGMFSPEISRAAEMQYLQGRQKEMRDRALAFAQLSPMQQADYGFYRGGQQLGDAIGGALGGQDPQLKLISQRQRLLSQLDRSDPESYKKIALQAQQTGDSELATLISEAGRKLELDTSLIKQRNREAKGAEPIQQIIRSGKYTPASVEAYDLSGKISDLREVDSPEKKSAGQKEAERIAEITRILDQGQTILRPIEKQALEAERARLENEPKETITQIEKLQKYRQNLVNSKASASDIAEVDAAIKALAEGNAPKIIMPGQQVAPKDWLAFSSQISKDPVMDRTSIIISDAPNAIETIRMSTSNDIASASLPGALARLTGEGKNMSDRDIRRYARTGGLDDRVAQDVVGFFTGRKTTVTKEQAERFATAVYRGALLERKKFIKDQAEQAGYDKTPNYDIAIRQLDDQLAKFKLIKPNDKSTSNQNLDADSLVNKYLKQK
jgi:hypothetical protein